MSRILVVMVVVFLVAVWSMWGLSSLTRDQTQALCIGSKELTTAPPVKSQNQVNSCQCVVYAYFAF